MSAAGPAAANIATSIQGFQYDQNALAFDGTVKSPNPHCAVGRTVTISSYDSSGKATTIGTAKTDRTGFFSFSAPDYNSQPGNYGASLPATKAKKHHPHTYNCAAANTGPQQYLG
jgi:hypothetical protein